MGTASSQLRNKFITLVSSMKRNPYTAPPQEFTNTRQWILYDITIKCSHSPIIEIIVPLSHEYYCICMSKYCNGRLQRVVFCTKIKAVLQEPWRNFLQKTAFSLTGAKTKRIFLKAYTKYYIKIYPACNDFWLGMVHTYFDVF